jgi:hypothetical protein
MGAVVTWEELAMVFVAFIVSCREAVITRAKSRKVIESIESGNEEKTSDAQTLL